MRINEAAGSGQKTKTKHFCDKSLNENFPTPKIGWVKRITQANHHLVIQWYSSISNSSRK